MKTETSLIDDSLEEEERFLITIKKLNSYISISFILIGIYLIYDSASLYYYYNYTSILFVFMKSSLELGGEFITGFFSIFCGIYCWMRYPFGLQSLFLFGVCLILYSPILIDIEYLLENIINASPFFIYGIFMIGYSRWKRLKWIYKK